MIQSVFKLWYSLLLHHLSLSLQRLYNPGWASASFKSFLHPSRFRATIFQFLHPSLATSSSTPSSQRNIILLHTYIFLNWCFSLFFWYALLIAFIFVLLISASLNSKLLKWRQTYCNDICPSNLQCCVYLKRNPRNKLRFIIQSALLREQNTFYIFVGEANDV